MTLPAADPKNDDPNIKVQRQMAYFLPLISILYGGVLPAGLFIYWITATIIQIFQQYLILGWGSMFPLFGWYPEFARNHQPRFPVKMPEIQPAQTRSTQRAGAREIRRQGHLCPVDDPAQPNAERATRETTLTMSEYQEFTGKSVEEAIKAACDAFSVGLGDLDFEILTPGSRGVLGMGAEPARIVAAPRSALGGAAPKREAAESTPLPAPPPREDRPYEDRGPRRDYGDRGPRRDYGDRGPRRDDRPAPAPMATARRPAPTGDAPAP